MALGTWGGVFCGTKMPCVTQVLSVEQRLDKFRLQISTYVKYDFFLTQNIGYICTSEVLIKSLVCFIIFFGLILFFNFVSFSLDEKRMHYINIMIEKEV